MDFTYNQKQLLAEMFRKEISATKDPQKTKELFDMFQILNGDRVRSSAELNVDAVIDNINDNREYNGEPPFEISNDDYEDVVRAVINYDYSDFNEFIERLLLDREQPHEEEEEEEEDGY